MSSSETDSDVSCPSDDSNYNFISQYMIEDAEIQVENRHELRASDDEGSSGLVMCLSIVSQSHAWVLAQLTKSIHIFVS